MSKQTALWASVLLVLGGGCTAVLGIDKDYHKAESSQAGGGGSPSSSTNMASASGPCMATGAEVCNDGIDNDCNGSADCADPACAATGFVCAPAIPSGWKSVAFSPTSRPSCPSGYTPVDIVSVSSAAFNCTCNCTLTAPPSCTQGTIGIASKGSDPCPASTTFSLNANGGECGAISLNTEKGGLVDIDSLPATQGSCSANVNSTIQPPSPGRACLAPAVGAGCAGGGACVASPQAPLVSCIAHDGALTCPSGYSKHFSVGTSAQDTRSCAPCSCGATATCTNPKLTLYTDSVCLVGDHDLPVTGACDPVNDGNGHSYKSYRYSATVTSPGCQKTVDTASMGSLTFMGERTICCD